jgi:lysophospholipase L1-like esterase
LAGQIAGGREGVAGSGGVRAESGGGGSGARAGQGGAGAGGTAAAGADGGVANGATGGSSAGADSAAGKDNAAGSNASGSGGHGGSDGPGGMGGVGGHAGEGKAITIWIAGDSTVANASNCPIGWGAMFADAFDERVTVTNRAVGGRSVRTWMYNVGTSMDTSGECMLATDSSGMPTLQPRWQEMLDGMQSGDYLFIQFGINDGSATCDRHVGIEAFKDTYGVLAEAAKARGTQPVFVTPVSAIACNGTTARGTRGSFVGAIQEAGIEFDVPVIDLHQLSVDLYNELGFCPIPGGSDVSASTGGEVGAFFCDDHTHFDRAGAERIAELVAAAVAMQDLGLAAYLK